MNIIKAIITEFCFAKHSETLEDMVVYEALYENDLGKIWVRPLTMFIENVDVNGTMMPRFKYIDSQSQQ